MAQCPKCSCELRVDLKERNRHVYSCDCCCLRGGSPEHLTLNTTGLPHFMRRFGVSGVEEGEGGHLYAGERQITPTCQTVIRPA